MKLYMHPASTMCRPIIHFIADNKIPVDMQMVDIFTGEHMAAPFAAINPSKLYSGAGGRRFSYDRMLGHPQISRR